MILPSTFTWKGGIEGLVKTQSVVDILNQLDVKHYEAGFTEQGEISMESMPAVLKQISQVLTKSKTCIKAMSTTILSGQNLISDDGSPQKRAVEILYKMIDVASYLGIPYVSFHCSSAQKLQHLDYGFAVKKELECLVKISSYAQDRGVTCCIENYIDGLLAYPADFNKLIEQADTKSLSACLDTGNAIFSGLPDRWVRCLKEKIKLVHFSDVKLRMLRGIVTEFVEPGKGIIDFQKVYGGLKETGFVGDIVLESFARPRQDDLETVRNLMNQFSWIDE